MIRSLLLAACFCALALSRAEAKPRSLQKMQIAQDGCSQSDMRPCGAGSEIRSYREEITKKRLRHRRLSPDLGWKEITHHSTARPRVVGSRPSGCPHRYCGCALSLKLFGRIIPRLNLAANWMAFPRALPAGGMVAARHGHVFLLKEHISGSTWLAWDPNSGRGRTRLHARSIAGFRIVDPRGARLAWR